ncbi:MAG: succinate dehydrogenase, cytochrome b556 subunit [Chloroflexi bacterium]|nr:succinate dehydrogenase, cytochrome b556 subunit [Chloroflexota bacterium]
MATIRTALTGYTRYRGREGQWSFLLHRITGLGVLLFLGIHILDTATVFFYPSLYSHAIAIYRTWPASLGEVVLVFCLFYHGVNGLRIAYFDMVSPKRWMISFERRSSLWTLLIAFILWLPPAVLMIRTMLIFDFGMFGGA